MNEAHNVDPSLIAQLKSLTERVAVTEGVIRDVVQLPSKAIDRIGAAKLMYAARRDRDIFFDPELFGEPAWDILLDLYIAGVEGRQISVSSSAMGARAALTTGLRWIAALVERGLAVRTHNVLDQRVTYVALSDSGRVAIEAFLDRYIQHLHR